MTLTPDLFAPEEPNIVLAPCQSLALRRMIDDLKADDSLYSACPEVVRRALADFLMPPYSSAEQQIADLEAARARDLELLEQFGRRINELEQRRHPITAGVRE